MTFLPKQKRTVELVGAPTDAGAGVRGCCMGPAALRVAGLPARLRARGVTVFDRGDLVGPANPECSPIDGYRHLAEVTAWCRAVDSAVSGALRAGRMPILLGGDHALAMGSISAVARMARSEGRPLRVLWLDAHADFNTSAVTPSGNLHGMAVATLCGVGPRELVALAGEAPALEHAWIRQLAVRCVDPAEKRLVDDAQIEVFDMRSIDELGMRAVMKRALEGMSPETHLHLSFDLDAIDPELAPGVGTPVPGGLTYREAQLCMESIADAGMLASLDLVEVNPTLDQRNRTAELAVDLVESLFGKSTLMRRPQVPA